MPAEVTDRDALIALLEFHVGAGIDIALDDAPHDRFAEALLAPSPALSPSPAPSPREIAPREIDRPAESRPSRPAEPSRPPTPLPRAATLPPDEVAADARARAAGANSLEELEAIVSGFDGCALKATAKRLVFADGRAGSRVMFVGEAPGADEDRTGRPFVGRAGQLLDRMLAAIDLRREDVYIANVVPWRPPGNRTPTPQEIAICLPFMMRQIELARPEIVVTVGASSTQALTGTRDGIMRVRGRWLDLASGDLRARVLPMLHPAYLLRRPIDKRLAWRDLRALRRALDEGASA